MESRFALKASVASIAVALAGLCMNAASQTTPTTPDTSAKPTAPAHPDITPTAVSKPSANGSSLSHADAKFVEKAAMGGVTEVAMGKLAQIQAQDPAVKDFGARMVKDHTKANDDLKPIADAKNIALPSAPDKSHQKDIDKLAKKTGTDFDKAYMDHMLKDHKKDVKEFQKEAKKAKDGDVKSFAENTLPTLEEHLRLAQQTHDAVHGKRARSSG